MNENIRFVSSELISDTVEKLFVEANRKLPCQVVSDIQKAKTDENYPLAESVLEKLLENLDCAEKLSLPICQDTGMAVVFVKLGSNVHITGSSLNEAVNEGVKRAYVNGKLRLSVVRDPLYERVNTGDNTPAVIHIETVSGEMADIVEITAAPKGFGSENMSRLKMMTPAASEDDIISFVVESVCLASSNPCPPIYVGVGIGGNFELSAILAKKALTRDTKSDHPAYASLEEKILKRINETGIGPQGFGGDTTALGVRIEYAPTHIAGLPVAVNINCHVSRHKTAVI